jgi:hypothetical protein
MPKKKTRVHPGARFGALVVGKPIRKNEHSQIQWEVKCDCGVTTFAWGYNLVKGNKNACAGVDRHIVEPTKEEPVAPPPEAHCETCTCYGKKKTKA